MNSVDMNPLLNAVTAKAGIEGRGAQAEIARFLGVTEQFVSKCVRRGYFPLESARALADEYNVSFVSLVKPGLRPHVIQA